MIEQTSPVPTAARLPLTMAQFVMLRSLGREGSWAEGSAPLWKVSRHWSHSREHSVEALGACWDLERLELVVCTPRTCCEAHLGGKVFALSERGKAMLVHINGRRGPATVVQLILVQAQHENALRLGSYQERFVKLVKSARKVAAGRSVRDLAELDGVLRSSTSVPLEFADSIASVLTVQARATSGAELPSTSRK
ncbi:hypothetical protein [Pseudomonas sp. 460]|uniref:hypothetical protein n=1 Tax=Pseudomonas sp. 460 TaxID=2485142 RepID=UPI00104E9471|nr:hypothetical protein [Pseudomonas sp. 460]TCV51450.1 hypothetical protein EDB99_107116 [Pseudomonas sp. 460]